MKMLLLLGVGVLIVQALLFWGYSAVKAVVERQDAGMVAWLLGAFFVALFVFVFVRSACHECLAFPSIAVCERRSGAIDVHLESNRIGGRVVERQFAGCDFYWHENNTGGKYGD